MLIWLLVLAIVVVASVVAVTRLRRARTAPPPRPAPPHPPTVPVDVSATIRSYVLPKRWLRGSRESPRASDADADAEHPRYVKATVERVNEAGARTGSWELLRGRTRLGRDTDNHVVLDDERVSLHHALITVREGVYWIEDLGSTNGTFVGDASRVMAAHPLADGEEVRLGGVVLVFRGVPGI